MSARVPAGAPVPAVRAPDPPLPPARLSAATPDSRAAAPGRAAASAEAPRAMRRASVARRDAPCALKRAGDAGRAPIRVMAGDRAIRRTARGAPAPTAPVGG